MRGHIIALGSVAALVLATLLACAISSQVTVGDLLDDTGRQFIATAAFYDQAYQAQAITKAEYDEFSAWAQHFQMSYDHAYQIWLKGGSTEVLVEELQRLKNELLIYVLKQRRAP